MPIAAIARRAGALPQPRGRSGDRTGPGGEPVGIGRQAAAVAGRGQVEARRRVAEARQHQRPRAPAAVRAHLLPAERRAHQHRGLLADAVGRRQVQDRVYRIGLQRQHRGLQAPLATPSSSCRDHRFDRDTAIEVQGRDAPVHRLAAAGDPPQRQHPRPARLDAEGIVLGREAGDARAARRREISRSTRSTTPNPRPSAGRGPRPRAAPASRAAVVARRAAGSTATQARRPPAPDSPRSGPARAARTGRPTTRRRTDRGSSRRRTCVDECGPSSTSCRASSTRTSRSRYSAMRSVVRSGTGRSLATWTATPSSPSSVLHTATGASARRRWW